MLFETIKFHLGVSYLQRLGLCIEYLSVDFTTLQREGASLFAFDADDNDWSYT